MFKSCEKYLILTLPKTRRKSLSDNWKANIGSVVIEQIELTERYRLWIDEVSQIFGGLDICAVEIVQSNDGKEFIIDVNDCTMQLVGETYEEDYQSIAKLIIHKMEIYCRPNQELTTVTRISSFDELKEISQNKPFHDFSNENIQQTSNTTHTEDTFSNLKKAFNEFFSNMLS
ncbi:unnamed protein product [Adineta steineri]|uniref:Synapsin ATP-binding domain-containing protein n=1 Tax=Adineta steineri TaxID=433720 RepID=A0A814I5D8_9BILA|nr:unnamed protein product [Adineta steineri]